MALGVRRSVVLLSALCRASSEIRQPLCIDRRSAAHLTLPGFDKTSVWQSILKGLAKKDIDGVILTRSVDSAIFWQRETAFVPLPLIKALIKIIRAPKTTFSKLSVTSQPVTLETDRKAIEREIAVLEASASAFETDGSGDLHDSLAATRDYLAGFERLVNKAKRKVGFDNACKDIRTCWGVGYLEPSDREYNQQAGARDLLEKMLEVGFPRPFAISLISAEAKIAFSPRY